MVAMSGAIMPEPLGRCRFSVTARPADRWQGSGWQLREGVRWSRIAAGRRPQPSARQWPRYLKSRRRRWVSAASASPVTPVEQSAPLGRARSAGPPRPAGRLDRRLAACRESGWSCPALHTISPARPPAARAGTTSTWGDGHFEWVVDGPATAVPASSAATIRSRARPSFSGPRQRGDAHCRGSAAGRARPRAQKGGDGRRCLAGMGALGLAGEGKARHAIAANGGHAGEKPAASAAGRRISRWSIRPLRLQTVGGGGRTPSQVG